MRHRSIVDRDNSNRKAPQEIQADAFAGEFLAPQFAVSTWMRLNGDPAPGLETVVRLAAAFSISAEAALIRLDLVNALDSKAQKRELKNEIDHNAHHELTARLGIRPITDSIATIDVFPRMPPALIEHGLAAIAAGQTSPARLAESLSVGEITVQQMMSESGIEEPEDEPDYPGV